MDRQLKLGVNITSDIAIVAILNKLGLSMEDIKLLEKELITTAKNDLCVPVVGDFFDFIDSYVEVFDEYLGYDKQEELSNELFNKVVIYKRRWNTLGYIELYLKLAESNELLNDNIMSDIQLNGECETSSADELDKGNSLFDIQFDGEWKPSKRFNDIFELVDDNGNVVDVATPDITKYRFIIGKENWGKAKSAYCMFNKCKQLVAITLPSDWGEIRSTIKMFSWCKKLESITMPKSWGNVEDVYQMFDMCIKLEKIILPKDWGNITDTKYMFYNCCKLSSITLPDNWGKVTYAKCMFYGCDKLENKPNTPRN